MNTTFKIPFYVKAALTSVGLFAFVEMLYIGQGIIVPVIYATILAIVLTPVVKFFERKKVNRMLAIAITIVLMVGVSITIVALLSSQVSRFSASFPALMIKLRQLLHETEAWVSQRFHIHISKVDSWIDETNAELLSSSRSLIGKTLVNIGNVLIVIVLIPVYIFMILYYQPHLVTFIHKLFSDDKLVTVNEVLTSTKTIIQSYLVGLLLEALIVATLNVTCLLILGIDYAILLGVIGAIVNVVPYLGGIIAVALPMIIALATRSPNYALLVLASYVLIQFIDNHIIIPKVVASKVQINALVSIIVVLAGGALWGLPGMFLSIPLTAIVKVVFDHIEGLKPWGYLLSDTTAESAGAIFRKIKTDHIYNRK